MSAALPTLKLKAREERRLRAGHLWAYSNELDTDASFRALEPGSLCKLTDSRDKPLGVGYVNPHTLLAVRLLSSDIRAQIDLNFIQRRIQSALELRARLYAAPYYRLVHGEGDALPGLVVDRYDDVLSVQITTAGMERLKPLVLEALNNLLKPRGIVLRNDSSAREVEGLPCAVEISGEVPDVVRVVEEGVQLQADLKGGQKTGFFFDQRDNRTRLARYAKGARVLDVFSYVGAWALRAAQAGAREVVCLDSSEPALAHARAAAQAAHVALETLCDDALAGLKALRAQGRSFDVVIVDPPALIKRRKDFEAGSEHYAALNRAAMQLLAADGILVSCSCSHHMQADTLQRLLLREARHSGRRLQILEQGGQGADHPIHPAIDETRYLKAFFCRALAG